MRPSTQEVYFIVKDQKFKGLSIGYDFCAEHEFGIENQLKKFDFSKGDGLTKARNNPFKVVYSEKPYFSISTYFRYIEPKGMFFNGINVMWDDSNIQITFNEEVDSTLLDAFVKMLETKDFTIRFIPKALRSSLCLIKYSEFPKIFLKSAEKKAQRLRVAREKFKNSKAMKALTKAKEDFIKNNPYVVSSFSTPYDYIYLDVVEGGGIWLNPSNQDYLNFTHVSEEDILKWAKGEPGKIIKDKKSWDYLNWELSLDAWSIMYRKKFFTGIEPKTMIWEKGKGVVTGKLLAALKKKDKSVVLDLLEAHIKNEINYYLGRWENASIETIPKDSEGKIILPYIRNLPIQTRNELDGELLGIGEMGYALGIFDPYGASNTPTVRENWAWWRDTLKAECEYNLFLKLGLIPDEYKGV